MPGWTNSERRRVGRAEEVGIAAVRRDATGRVPRPIRVVRAGDSNTACSPGATATRVVRDLASRGKAYDVPMRGPQVPQSGRGDRPVGVRWDLASRPAIPSCGSGYPPAMWWRRRM
jgi:hypothetical protein